MSCEELGEEWCGVDSIERSKGGLDLHGGYDEGRDVTMG